MSRARAAEQLRALQARQLQLRQELTELSALKRSLLLRNALLACWCDALSYMQLVGGMQQPGGTPHDAEAAKFEQLLVTEIQLLQQLTSKGGPLGDQTLLEQLLQPDSSTIAPCTDPMAYLQHFVGQTPTEQTLSMDGQAVAALMQHTTQTVSIKLHQLNTVPPWERAGVLKQIADAWETYFHCQCSLTIHGKQSVLEAAMTINLNTMQPEPAEAVAHQAEQAAVVVRTLQLTEQQQEIVCVGMGIYYDMLAVIHHKCQDINNQRTAVLEEPCADGALADAHGDSSGGRASSAWDMQDLAERRDWLEKQEELTNQLDLLLHKEYKLRLAAMGWFVGSLNYEQLSRLAVMSWPYGMRLLFLATEIMQQSRTHSLDPPQHKSSGSSGDVHAAR